jgi:hypothetical protein
MRMDDDTGVYCGIIGIMILYHHSQQQPLWNDNNMCHYEYDRKSTIVSNNIHSGIKTVPLVGI